jgi:hypothetical protein
VAAVVTVVVLGFGAVRARSATSSAALAAFTRTTSTRAPTLLSTTTVAQPRATPSTPPTSTTTTVAMVAAEPRPSRETCLALAAVNHYRVVAANDAWLRRQLHDLAARNLLSGPQAGALQIEEAQARTEIEAQYAIDRSNCYLK